MLSSVSLYRISKGDDRRARHRNLVLSPASYTRSTCCPRNSWLQETELSVRYSWLWLSLYICLCFEISLLYLNPFMQEYLLFLARRWKPSSLRGMAGDTAGACAFAPGGLKQSWPKPGWWWFLFSREVVSSSLQPHGLQHARLPCPSVCQSLLRLMSIELMMPSNHLIVCCPFILLLLPDVFPRIRVFSNGSVLCTSWPECWSFSFSISPSNEFSGLISFRIDWFDPAVQGTLRSLLQHHSWKASIHWRSAFFMVQLSHPYMTTGKIIALTIWTFVNKVMSLICCLGLS